MHAIAAQTNDEILFAHFTSHQYLAKGLGGNDHDATTRVVKDFVQRALIISDDNVLWVINYNHQPGNLNGAKLKLALPLSQIRVAGREGYKDVTLDMGTFEIYRGAPNQVNDQANLADARYDFPLNRTGASNNANRRQTDRCECVIL